MRQAWALLLLLPLLTQACFRTAATTTKGCAAVTGEVLLAGSFTVASTFYGDVQPVQTCTTCAAGTANYYPPAANVVPTASDQEAIGGLTCTNLCVCQSDGKCFTRNEQNVNVVLYPSCAGGTCTTYVVLTSQTDTGGLVSTDGSTTFLASNQIDSNLNPLPVTSGAYPSVSYASCNGCSSQTTC